MTTDIFTNREISLFIWAGFIITILFLKARNIGKPLVGMLKLLFGSKLLILLLLLCNYIFLLVYIFYRLSLWDTSLLKSTIFWFFGSALVLFFHFNRGKDLEYFKHIAKDTFKWTVLVEFLGNFYCFSLPVELLILPIMLFVALTQVVAQTDKKFEQIGKFFSKVLVIAGIILLAIISYKTVTQYTDLFTIDNLKEILLAPIFTILLLPFVYFISLLSSYETTFMRVDFRTSDLKQRKIIKNQILMVANFNLSRLTKISSNIFRQEFSETNDISKYLKTITRTGYS